MGDKVICGMNPGKVMEKLLGETATIFFKDKDTLNGAVWAVTALSIQNSNFLQPLIKQEPNRNVTGNIFPWQGYHKTACSRKISYVRRWRKIRQRWTW